MEIVNSTSNTTICTLVYQSGTAEPPRGIKGLVPVSKLGWRQPILIERVPAAVTAELEGTFHGGKIVSLCRAVQHRPALEVHGVGVGTACQQQVDGARPLAADSVVQDRLAARVPGFYAGADRQP